MNNPDHDDVAMQYEKWVYPLPITDLNTWLETNWEWFDPSHAHQIFWPEQQTSSSLEILVAGCGSNQAAVIAHNNPNSQVLGIDVSESSLTHQKYLKERHTLHNLQLLNLPIEDLYTLNRKFDLIISTGVLHHLRDPKVGMRALGDCLNTNGVVAIMLYAKYGRIGVEILQSIFTELGLGQEAPSLEIVQETLSLLPDQHPIKSYLQIAPDLDFESGIVDTFLHKRDISFSVEDCLTLVQQAGLVFQDWFFKGNYYPDKSTDSILMSRISELPKPQQWSIMERINTQNACHFFTAHRPEQRRFDYTTVIQGDKFFQCIPSIRHPWKFNGYELIGSNHVMTLSGKERVLFYFIDGNHTMNEIVNRASTHDEWKDISTNDIISQFKDLLDGYWATDLVAIQLNRSE